MLTVIIKGLYIYSLSVMLKWLILTINITGPHLEMMEHTMWAYFTHIPLSRYMCPSMQVILRLFNETMHVYQGLLR